MDGKTDFDVRHTWLSCLVTVMLSKLCHLLELQFPPPHKEESSGFLAGLS